MAAIYVVKTDNFDADNLEDATVQYLEEAGYEIVRRQPSPQAAD